eukprot:1134139-Pleurochrysis_carterae.AAC.1
MAGMAKLFCSFHALTGCILCDSEVKSAGQQPCNRCGKDGMHHRFCAAKPEYVEATKCEAADESLCSLCAKLLTAAEVTAARKFPRQAVQSIAKKAETIVPEQNGNLLQAERE